MDRIQPVMPAYGRGCIDSIVPALMAGPGQRAAWLPHPAQEATQVVLLVLDGLGWQQLLDRRRVAATLAAMPGGPITSVVPSTTATALASIALGSPPARHGIVGYRVRVAGPTGDEVLNVLRWRTVSGDARSFAPPASFQGEPAFFGRRVPVVTRSEFLGSGFSLAHLGSTRQVGWMLPSALVVEVRHLLASGEPLVYAYYDGIDKIAHGHGLGEHFDAELAAVDRLVGDLAGELPRGAALVVTADHGQVVVGERVRPIDHDVVAETWLISGEGRFRWLHVRPGAVAAVTEAARARHGHEAWVWTVDELDEGRWFGGPLSATARQRLGDVALVPFEPVAYLDPADPGDARLISRHGSLTDAEMLVPLLASGH